MELIIWTIYDHPLDFPHHYVMAPFLVKQGSPEPIPYAVRGLYATLDEAREDALDMGLGLVPRAPGDHPTVVESWL